MIAALIGSLGSLAMAASPVALPATADTPSPGQMNACWSKLTSNWATFPLSISGSVGSPIAAGGTTTLTNTGINFGVGASLALAGIGAGVLTGAPNVASMGFPGTDPINGNSFPQLGVNTAKGSAQLSIRATNSVEGTQRVVNPSLSAQFVVITDGNAAHTHIYSVGPGGVVPGTLTNLTETPALIVPIAFPNTTWTNSGSGPMVFSERATVPTLPTPPLTQLTPTGPDLFIGVQLGVSANFYCWPGQSQGALDTTQTPPVPGSSPNMTPAGSQAGLPAGAPPNVIATIATATIDTSLTTTTNNGSSTSTSTSTTTTEPSTTTSTTVSGPTTVPETVTTVPGEVLQTKTASYATDCTNTLQPGTVSHLPFKITATAPVSAPAGKTFFVTKQTWTVTTPGSLIDLGIAAGLLNPNGGDTIQATVTPALSGSNTAEKIVKASPIHVAVGPTTVDPSTGKAHDITNSFNVPNMGFTSGGGTVHISMSTTAFSVSLPPLKAIVFTCVPTKPPTLLTITIEGTATTTTVAVSNEGSTVAPTSTATSTSGTTTSTLPFTGSRQTWLLVGLALLMLDLGALALLATWDRKGRPRHVE
jgi:hypothetical protein